MIEKTVVVDTCATKAISLMEILKNNFKKVALTTAIIKEMDLRKQIEKNEGTKQAYYNIDMLFKECAIDKNSQFYEVIESSESYSYVDDDTISFLVKNKEKYCILTFDNGLACRCKGHKVDYYFPWEFDEYSSQTEGDNQEYLDIVATLDNTYRSGNDLFLQIPNNSKNIKAVVFDKKGIEQEQKEYGIKLEESFKVYIMTYKRNAEIVKVAEYKVLNLSKENNVLFSKCYTFKEEDEIEGLDWCKVLKDEAREYFRFVNSI